MNVHHQLPLEAFARMRRASREIDFARRLAGIGRHTPDVRFDTSDDGLRILAADEDSLANAALLMRSLYGDSIEVCRPTIRLLGGPPLQQPIMTVRVSARRQDAAGVRGELQRRNARIVEESPGSRFFAVRALAPMGGLLGLPATLAAMTDRTAVHWIRLSHYEPVTSSAAD